jgi:SAM-dependent methyltransferase
MHLTAEKTLNLFLETYTKGIGDDFVIVEIGSKDVSYSPIKNMLPEKAKYLGIDLEEGNNVDIVLEDPYDYPVESESVDIVVCTSCFEHTEFFWLAYIEILRILKPSGVVYINAPSNGYFHRFAYDYYRFYPDTGLALENWGKKNNINCKLLESFIGGSYGDIWNDFACVVLKDEEYLDLYDARMVEQNIDFFNGISSKSPGLINPSLLSEDLIKLENMTYLKVTKQKYNLLKYKSKKTKYEIKIFLRDRFPSLVSLKKKITDIF